MLKTLLALTSLAIPCLSSAPAAQQGSPAPPMLALVGGIVVDGTGAPPIPDAVVLIRNGRIEAVGPASQVQIPEGAQRVNLMGRTLLPGFVNAHGHANDTQGLASGPQFNTRENVQRQLALYARYGVTSVFSLGGDGPPGVAIRAEPAVGRTRLFIAGPIVVGTTPAAVTAEVDALAATKVDWVKIRVDPNLGAGSMPLPIAKATIDRAHALGLPVAAHLYTLGDAKQLVRDGLDVIAHSIRDQPVDDELIALMRPRDVCVIPTLTREVSTYVYESTPLFFRDPFFLMAADEAVVTELRNPVRQQTFRTADAQRNKAALAQASRNLKLLHAAGVRIAMGTDTGPPLRFQGFFEHMELELMVKAGLTPMQAIVAATGDAARCMKRAGQIGTIQPGAWADLALYRLNPVEDISNTHTLEAVLVGGVGLPAPEFRLGLVDRAGNRTMIGRLPAGAFSPRLSPDGTRIAVDAAPGTVYVAPLLDPATWRQLGPGRFPVWSADGRQIVFTNNDTDQVEALFLRTVDGNAAPETLLKPGRAAESWSAAAQTLSVLMLNGEDYSIRTMSLAQKTNAPFVDAVGSTQMGSQFSRDGRWIAYDSNESGRYEVYVEPFPRNGTRHKITSAGGRRPLWSSDGTEIFFDDGAASPRMMAVKIRTSPMFSTDAPETLPIIGFIQGTARRQYDITPDGKFVMMFR